MEGALGLNSVSSVDIDRKTGEKSKLETGSNRSYNMPKECVERMMKGKKKMSRKQAEAAGYREKGKKGNPSKKSAY